jgi:hypothetical protein
VVAPSPRRASGSCRHRLGELHGDAGARQARDLASLIVAGRIQIGRLLISHCGPIVVGVEEFLPVQSDLAEPTDGYPPFPSNVLLAGSVVTRDAPCALVLLKSIDMVELD